VLFLPAVFCCRFPVDLPLWFSLAVNGVDAYRQAIDVEPADHDSWEQALHDEEIAFIPPTKWGGETVGRFAFPHPHTGMDLVREILDRTK